MRDFADFFAPKRGKSSTSNRLLSQNTMRGLSLVLASHSFVTLVNLSLFSYKFAIFLCKFAIFFHTISPLFSFSSFLSSLAKARLISPNLPILMRCFCRLRTKFLTKFLCKISRQIQSTALQNRPRNNQISMSPLANPRRVNATGLISDFATTKSSTKIYSSNFFTTHKIIAFNKRDQFSHNRINFTP